MTSSSLKLILGLPIVIVMFALLLLNGVTMLFSPAAWFRMPKFLAFRGAMIQGRTNDLTVRIIGFLFTVTVLWVIAMIITGGETAVAPRGGDAPVQRHSLNGIVSGAACLIATVYGVIMIFMPGWWIKKYGPKAIPSNSPAAAGLAMAIRVTGILVTVLAFFIASKIITPMR
jgi:hypothetical protein